MQKLKFIILAALAAASVLLLLPGKDSPSETKPLLVATTNVISSLAEEISGAQVKTITMIPPGNCPGYFDMKISTLRAIGDSGVILAHGFESYLPAVKKALGEKEIKIYGFTAPGNWMVPEVQIVLAGMIKDALVEIFPEKKHVFKKNFEAFLNRTQKTGRDLQAASESAGIAGTRAICNQHLKEQLEYFGMVITGTYGSKEELTAYKIRELFEKGFSKETALVIDNLQAGPDTGKALARDLGAAHAVISNFPEGFPDTPTLSSALKRNLDIIIAATGNPPDDRN